MVFRRSFARLHHSLTERYRPTAQPPCGVSCHSVWTQEKSVLVKFLFKPNPLAGWVLWAIASGALAQTQLPTVVVTTSGGFSPPWFQYQ